MHVVRRVVVIVLVLAVEPAVSDIGGKTLQEPSPEELLVGGGAGAYSGRYGGGRTYTEHTSVEDEIKQAGSNAMMGMLVFIVGFPVLFFNELRQAKMWELFGRAARITRTNVSADVVSPENNRGLVHVSGTTRNAEQLSDPLFNITVENCIKLTRHTEMYQWEEQKVKTGQKDTYLGGKEATYTCRYTKQWRSDHVQSSGFQESGHDNPAMNIDSGNWTGHVVKLGAFTLPEGLKSMLCKSVDCTGDVSIEKPFAAQTADKHAWEFWSKPTVFRRSGGYLTTQDSDVCDIGDVRVWFTKVPCGPTTVLAVQLDDTFVEMPFTAKVDISTKTVAVGSDLEQPLLDEEQFRMALAAGQGSWSCATCGALCSCVGKIVESGESVFEIEERNCTAEVMLKDAGNAQNCRHWLGILVGWLLIVIGLDLMLSVVPALFRIVPFLGAYLQAFGDFIVLAVSVVIGSFLGLMTIALGWLYIRPVKTAIIFAFALILLFLPTILDAAGVHIGQDK